MNTQQAVQRLREVVRRQHKAISTESTYVFWLRGYMRVIPGYPGGLTSEQKLERFLTELARDRCVSTITQNQAFNAILFFYRDVLGHPWFVRDHRADLNHSPSGPDPHRW